jgi:predicted AAA+ superfamily ATPase
MWYKRDFDPKSVTDTSLPIKILKGPRQVGKTSLLERIPDISVIRVDDLSTRNFLEQNPRLFLDQFKGAVLIDEAPLAGTIFSELKRRVDEARRNQDTSLDYWLTGSNQTLLRQSTSESLAGRANFFDLNTLSIHELGDFNLERHLLRGGWPELAVSAQLSPDRYLNDFVSTFIDRDIVAAAGIERKASFSKALGLTAARQGMLMNYSEIAGLCGVDVTTIQSWIALLQENGILRIVEPYSSNLNKRLSKTPKVYFEDVALASRLQGWTDTKPLMLSIYFGFLLETIVLTEISRFFSSRGQKSKVFHLRTKEKVEIDFLVELPNQKYLAIEVKSTPQAFSTAQNTCLDSLGLNIVGRWILTPQKISSPSPNVLHFEHLYDLLASEVFTV